MGKEKGVAGKSRARSRWTSNGGISVLIAGADPAIATSNRVTIIGGGRIGSLLASSTGGKTVLLGRDNVIDASDPGPILICTRNDALDGIVDACPENRRKDLVFVQNGYLDEFLESKGLLDNTQALLYFSVDFSWS